MTPVRRARSIRSLLPHILLANIFLATSAHAETGCSAASGVDSLRCSLSSYLHTLHALAALLGAILFVVVILAVAYYRKAKHSKLEP